MATSTVEDEYWSFLADWPDPQAGITRKFAFRYFPKDRGVEMTDLRTQRLFLRRSRCESLWPEQVALGASVTVMGRELRLADYGDERTRARLGRRARQRTLLVVSAGAVRWVSAVLQDLYAMGVAATRLKMVRLTREQAAEFFTARQEEEGFSELLDQVISGPLLVVEMRGEGSLEGVTSALGDPRGAGSSDLRHAPSDAAAAKRELAWFFPDEAGGGGGGGERSAAARLANTARLGDVTCCIVKPHALTAGCLGKIIGGVTEAGFEISAMGSFVLDRVSAAEFYEVYKGILPEYGGMVGELCSGPCVAMELRRGGGDGNVVARFRELCGPADPELGRLLRPRSLRAQLGTDTIRNAVHCSDLPEDGELEVEYFFRILDT